MEEERPLCERDPEQARLCSCARLWSSQPLRSGEALPDHVSEGALQMACYTWIDQALGKQAPLGARAVLTLASGLHTEPVRPSDWPVPLRSNPYRVHGVIRQWVEEPPDRQLARLLEGEPVWHRAVAALRGACEGADAEAVLLAHGLPHTPGSVEYLRACADGAPESAEYPTRGVLVTSVVLRARSEAVRLPDMVISQVTSSYHWSTDALRRRASVVATEHARWWEEQPGSYMPEMDLRRLNRRAPDDLAEDIRAWLRGELTPEEVEQRAVQRERSLAPAGWCPDMKKAVLRRVRRRLRDAELRNPRLP